MRILSVIVTTAVLAGCATGPTKTSLDEPNVVLPDVYGIVVVQVVTNAERVGPLLDNWTSLYAVNVDSTDQTFELKPKKNGLVRNRVFVGAFPPGRYAFYRLQAWEAVGNGARWTNANFARTVGSFEVIEGRITSLGTLVYQPLGKFERDGTEYGIYTIARIDDYEDLVPFVADAYPEFHAEMESDATLGWFPDELDNERAETAENLRAVAWSGAPRALADGVIASGGMLGQIYWRSADGDWSRTDTGFTNQILDVSQTQTGFVAGGDRGLVLVASELAGPWMRIDGPPETEAITWIEEGPDSTLFVKTQSDSVTKVYLVGALDGDWREVFSQEYSPGPFFTGRGGVYPIVTEDGELVVFAEGRRITIDTDSGEQDSTEGHHHFRLVRQRDGTLQSMLASLWSGTGDNMYSIDDGRTWTTIERVSRREWFGPSTLRGLPFRRSDGGVVIVSHKSAFEIGARKRTEEVFLRIGDGRGDIASWGIELEEGCRTILPEISTDSRVFIKCDDGRLLRSDDDGLTWHVDRDVVLDDLRDSVVDDEGET